MEGPGREQSQHQVACGHMGWQQWGATLALTVLERGGLSGCGVAKLSHKCGFDGLGLS